MTTTPAQRRWSIAAAVWAGAFAAVHVYWALGGNAGLGAAADDNMTGWFLWYDLLATVLCLVAAAAAVVLARGRGGVIRPVWWSARRLVLLGAVLLLIRGIIGLVQLAAWLVTDRDQIDVTAVWEPYFLLGGLLFLLAWRSGRGSSQPTPSERSSR